MMPGMIPFLIVLGVLVVAVCVVGAIRASKLRRDNLAASMARHGFREDRPDQVPVAEWAGAPFDDPRATHGVVTRAIAGVYRTREIRAFDYAHDLPAAGGGRAPRIFLVYVLDCRSPLGDPSTIDLPAGVRSGLEAFPPLSFRTESSSLVVWEEGRLEGWATKANWLDDRLDLLSDLADALTGEQTR